MLREKKKWTKKVYSIEYAQQSYDYKGFEDGLLDQFSNAFLKNSLFGDFTRFEELICCV